ncbi:MAG: ABC transporter substrate-binding protein [Arthrobacter sp.]|uniref:ABC transporter substrate-binding protein n=1 Tax=Arthrobacter sp. TaxID=1667 RepID=UPI00347E25EE
MSARSPLILESNRRTFLVGALVAGGGALGLSACGSGSPSGAPAEPSGSGGALESVTLGLIPITDVAPVYLGLRQGYFRDAGIDLTVQMAQGGAAILPAVMTGDFLFGYSNVVSLLIAADKGLPITVISNGSSSTNTPGEDVTEVAALPASGISGPLDLVGKTVAVNALNNFADVTIRNSVERAGGDPDGIRFVEMPYPNMPAALERGDVDAAWTTEPFRTQILEAGGRIVASPMTDMAPDFDSAYYFTSRATLEDRPELVAGFRGALAQSFAYAMEHEDEVRAIVQDYAKVTPELAETVVMSVWTPRINRDALAALGGAAATYGVLSKEPDADALISE